MGDSLRPILTTSRRRGGEPRKNKERGEVLEMLARSILKSKFFAREGLKKDASEAFSLPALS